MTEEVEVLYVEDSLKEKLTEFSRGEIESGVYTISIECLEGKFTLDVALFDKDNGDILNFTGKKLKKGKKFEETQEIDDEDAPAKLDVSMKKSGKGKYLLRVTRKTKVISQISIRVRLLVKPKRGEFSEKYVNLKPDIVKYPNLKKRMEVKFGDKMVMRYKDPLDGGISTIEDQESLDHYFDENRNKKEGITDIYFTYPEFEIE